MYCMYAPNFEEIGWGMLLLGCSSIQSLAYQQGITIIIWARALKHGDLIGAEE